MTTKDDITFVLDAPDTYFFCKKCKTKFKQLENAEFTRWKMQSIEEAKSMEIVDSHIRTCNCTE